MNFISKNNSQVVIRQIPFVLLFVTAIFGLIPFVTSLVLILGGIESDGKIFGLGFGLLMLWLFLEFVATRETIEIDLNKKMMTRTVSGVFRKNQQVIGLSKIKAIVLEYLMNSRGRKRQYLYMYGLEEKHLICSPSKVYIDHGKMGKLLNEVTGIPYQVQDFGFSSLDS